MRRLAVVVACSVLLLAVAIGGFGHFVDLSRFNPSKSVAAAETPVSSGAGSLTGVLPRSPGYSETSTEIMTVYHNVTYASPDGEPLLLDAYIPNGGVHPAVIVIHGGGWTYGDKQELAFEGENLAAAGFGAFVVNYRLAPPNGDVHAPVALHDVSTALDWVRDNAVTYRIDADRVGVLGNSAGGNLAMMLGVGGANGIDHVNAVVSYSGQSNLLTLSTRHTIHAATNYIGCAATTCRAVWIANSPIDHCTAATAPMLLVNSTDELMPLDQATDMAARLNQVGVPHELKVLKGKKHASEFANEVWPETLDFLNQYLGS
ncbi:MAG TPA: alpha/beta hydrolase [Nitrolancea sp.]